MKKAIAAILIIIPGCITLKSTPGNFHSIPLQFTNNLLLLRLEVNGKSGHFIIDTGASISLIDQVWVEHYGFKVFSQWNRGTLNGFGGQQSFIPVSNPVITHSGVALKSTRFYSANLGSVTGHIEQTHLMPIGILGANFLLRNKAVINYSNRTLQLNHLNN